MCLNDSPRRVEPRFIPVRLREGDGGPLPAFVAGGSSSFGSSRLTCSFTRGDAPSGDASGSFSSSKASSASRSRVSSSKASSSVRPGSSGTPASERVRGRGPGVRADARPPRRAPTGEGPSAAALRASAFVSAHERARCADRRAPSAAMNGDAHTAGRRARAGRLRERRPGRRDEREGRGYSDATRGRRVVVVASSSSSYEDDDA